MFYRNRIENIVYIKNICGFQFFLLASACVNMVIYSFCMYDFSIVPIEYYMCYVHIEGGIIRQRNRFYSEGRDTPFIVLGAVVKGDQQEGDLGELR